jgi:hypothetical protein
MTARPHLKGHANSQSTRALSTASPNTAPETPLAPLEIGVQCTAPSSRIVGAIFMENITNSELYIDTAHEFLGRLTKNKSVAFSPRANYTD